MLRVDNGMSWRTLLDELDAGPASIAGGRAPQSRPGAPPPAPKAQRASNAPKAKKSKKKGR
jgi:hypothetical protein